MNAVRKIINEWDPINLFPAAPDNEYWSEIEEIERLMNDTDNTDALAVGIYTVFVKSFGDDVFQRSKSECKKIAQMIEEKVAAEEKLYLVKFEILQEEYYTFWYTDDIDGFLLDQNGSLKFFPTKEEAIAFAKESEFLLDTEELLISSSILRKMNIRKINCSLFLNHWNMFHDVAHSINCPFLGDSWTGNIQTIYEKLFYGCNIFVKEDEEHYRPKWSKKERRLIAKVMKDGFKILEKGLNAKWRL